MALKVKINENYTNILNYINSSDNYISLQELIQYCIDYDQYKEFYINYHIFKDLLMEHNRSILILREERERKRKEAEKEWIGKSTGF